MKAGDVLMRIVHTQLLDDVVPYGAGGAGGERREWPVGEMQAQRAKLPVIGAKLGPPLRDAVRFVYGEKGDGNLRKPRRRVGARDALGRKIQQAVGAVAAWRMICDCCSCASELFSKAAGMPICASCAI